MVWIITIQTAKLNWENKMSTMGKGNLIILHNSNNSFLELRTKIILLLYGGRFKGYDDIEPLKKIS